MRIKVVSYSLTGNNQAVASRVAAGLGIERIELREEKKRQTLDTVLDIIFNRTPAVSPGPEAISGCDLVLLFAPVWIGHIATPLRSYLKYIGEHRQQYGLITVCSGINRNLKARVKSYTGFEPTVFLELAIMAELGVRKPFYRLQPTEAEKLAERVLAVLRQHLRL